MRNKKHRHYYCSFRLELEKTKALERGLPSLVFKMSFGPPDKQRMKRMFKVKIISVIFMTLVSTTGVAADLGDVILCYKAIHQSKSLKDQVTMPVTYQGKHGVMIFTPTLPYFFEIKPTYTNVLVRVPMYSGTPISRIFFLKLEYPKRGLGLGRWDPVYVTRGVPVDEHGNILPVLSKEPQLEYTNGEILESNRFDADPFYSAPEKKFTPIQGVDADPVLATQLLIEPTKELIRVKDEDLNEYLKNMQADSWMDKKKIPLAMSAEIRTDLAELNTCREKVGGSSDLGTLINKEIEKITRDPKLVSFMPVSAAKNSDGNAAINAQ